MTYKNQLNDPRWKLKRQQILERDKHTCLSCGSKKNLHVHHTAYTDIAWEVSDYDLATLCFSCHRMEHFLLKKELELKDTPDCMTIVFYKHPTLGELTFVPGAPDGADMVISKDGFGEYFAVDVNEFKGL